MVAVFLSREASYVCPRVGMAEQECQRGSRSKPLACFGGSCSIKTNGQFGTVWAIARFGTVPRCLFIITDVSCCIRRELVQQRVELLIRRAARVAVSFAV